jgi:predicted nucleic acid-binding protein
VVFPRSEELLLLPIRRVALGNIPDLMRLAVEHNLSVYDACYLKLALLTKLPIATNDDKLKFAAEANRLATIVP